MSYRYNEKTGEFEDVPGLDKKHSRPNTSPQTPQETDSEMNTVTKILLILVRLLLYAIGAALLFS